MNLIIQLVYHVATIKFLTKVLASRHEKIQPKCIHQDQTGFIVGRQLSSNLYLMIEFNAIYQSKNAKIIISLDAQKAFDKIEYNTQVTAIERFGLGPIFSLWIKVLYTAPQASVRTN